MVFEGQEVFAYDITDVWAAMHNVELLKRALPGCKSMTATGENSYVVALSLGVAAVKGEYEGRVKITDLKVPSHYMIEGEGTGAPGFVKLRMDCWFEPQRSGALMRWKCEATVGGVIASVGGKVLSGISKFLAKQFFKSFRNEMDELTASSQGGRGKLASSYVEAAGPGLPAQHASSRSWLIRFFRSIWQRFSRQ